MTSDRELRLAENEAIFRLANERMAAWEERDQPEERELYFCECGDADCREKVELVQADYERVRSDPSLFFVAPGHELPEMESVVEAHDGWTMVRKGAEVREVVEAMDPRG